MKGKIVGRGHGSPPSSCSKMLHYCPHVNVNGDMPDSFMT